MGLNLHTHLEGWVRPETAADLARAMEVLGTDRDLRQAMSDAGREHVGAEYIWDTKGERLDALYESVLNRAVTTARVPVT